MKKKLFLKFFVLAVIGAFVTFTSCKDYDDDISKLEKDIASLQSTLNDLKSKVDGGAVITDVATTTDGVKVTLSDGKSFNLTNGTNGIDGKPGSVVEVGENGNWFIDGTDTGLAAKGKDGENGKDGVDGKPGKDGENGKDGVDGKPGKDGENGKDGVDGKPGKDGENGKDGKYYYPGENGFWVEVDGETETETDKTWLPEGTITAVWENGSVILYNVEGTEGPVVIGVVAVNTLTLIPDFVADKGGALPIIDFSPLETECGDIAPAVTVRYKVNKNATESSINKNAIYFMHNTPTVRAGEETLNPKAEFESLENGVLTVKVDVNTAALLKESTGKIDQLMLVVPLTNGDEVHSDWAKVTAEPVDEIALAKKEVYEDDDVVLDLIAKTLQDAMDNDPIIEIAYTETIDLLDWVTTVLEDAMTEFDINRYGLEYAFDLKGLDGKTIVYELGVNKTDQQKFINLVGSKVSTRVYDLEGANPASIDRTPIVHVYLKDKKGSLKCNVADGFIKLSIVAAKVDPIPPVKFEKEGNVEAGCDDFVLKVETQEMNEKFYAAAKLSKEQFHKSYKWDGLVTEENGVGTIEEVVDPEDTQSYNLVWTVTPAELAANVGKTITKSGTYTYGSSVIKVIFTATVTQPEIDLGGMLITNYWDANKSFVKHNVATPDAGDDDSDNATFANNINNAFVTNADKLLALADTYEYEYFFAPKKDQPIQTVKHEDGKNIVISVSDDGKELLAKKGDDAAQVVATILEQGAGTGDILSYNEDSDLGKYLLNKAPEFMKARLYVKATLECNPDVEVKVKGLAGGNAFNVHFLRPVNNESVAPGYFVDAVDFGKKYSYIDVNEVLGLSDWRNIAKNTTDYNFEPDNLNYYGYYGVKDPEFDLENIKPKGLYDSKGNELKDLPSTIVIKQVDDFLPYGGVLGEDEISSVLTYKNNGNNLENDFSLLVPVTLEYKWGVISTTIEVKVKGTASTRSAQ